MGKLRSRALALSRHRDLRRRGVPAQEKDSRRTAGPPAPCPTHRRVPRRCAVGRPCPTARDCRRHDCRPGNLIESPGPRNRVVWGDGLRSRPGSGAHSYYARGRRRGYRPSGGSVSVSGRCGAASRGRSAGEPSSGANERRCDTRCRGASFVGQARRPVETSTTAGCSPHGPYAAAVKEGATDEPRLRAETRRQRMSARCSHHAAKIVRHVQGCPLRWESMYQRRNPRAPGGRRICLSRSSPWTAHAHEVVAGVLDIGLHRVSRSMTSIRGVG